MTPVDLAGAAAAAMEPGAGGRPPSARRALFAPLWRAVLASAERYGVETIVRMADEVLSDAGAAWREREVVNARTAEPDTVAGIVSSNPGMFEDCARLIRGCRTLAGALDASAGDDGVIEEAYSDLAPFWSQSHQVRMLGALVTDLAPDPDRMDRALNVRSGTSAIVISWRRSPFPATAAGRDRRSDG